MFSDELLVGLTLIVLLFVLVKEFVTPVIAFVGATTLMLTAGIITPEQAFAGFSNPTVIIIGSLFVISALVEKTIGIDYLLNKLAPGNKLNPSLYSRLLVPITASSGFLNNTPLVAMLINPISKWAKRRHISPSKLLLPLSYAAILGGVITVIGTSTNLVVSGLLLESGFKPIGFFEITAIGLPVALIGVVFLAFASKKMLPSRTKVFSMSGNLRKTTISLQATKNIDGKSIHEAGLRDLQGVYLVSLQRESGDVIAPVPPDTNIQTGDYLSFAGSTHDIVDLEGHKGLKAVEARHIYKMDATPSAYFEVVLGKSSPIIGKTLKSFGFRGKYQAAVLAVHRGDEELSGKLGSISLEPGDSLLVVADDDFEQRWKNTHDFLVIQEISSRKSDVKNHNRSFFFIAAAMVAIKLLTGAPLVAVFILGVVLSIAFRLISVKEARNAIDWDLLVLIAAAIGFAQAVDVSGLADTVSQTFQSWFGGGGPVAALFGIVLLTLILTELITNAAAASLIFPIAIGVAAANGVDPRAFAIAVAVTASLSFLSPFGYQTNTMVYGPGGYKFIDYIKLGLPLTVVSAATVLLLTPLIYDF